MTAAVREYLLSDKLYIKMEPLLEKLSNEFGSREVQTDGLNSAPSEKQPSCLGDMSRDSTFEERLVDR